MHLVDGSQVSAHKPYLRLAREIGTLVANTTALSGITIQNDEDGVWTQAQPIVAWIVNATGTFPVAADGVKVDWMVYPDGQVVQVEGAYYANLDDAKAAVARRR